MQGVIDGVTYEIPNHVAVIMDGNGRWAKKRLMPRGFGHRQGGKALEQACEDIWHLGVKYFTVYAFSTENWKRSVEEVTGIMNILRNYLKTAAERCNRENMRMRVIGDRHVLDADIQSEIHRVEEATKQNTGLQFTVAINYGGRDEIRRAVTKIADEVKAGTLSPEEVRDESDRGTSGYMGASGSGPSDPYQRRREDLEFPSLAAGICGVLFYGCTMAGF